MSIQGAFQRGIPPLLQLLLPGKEESVIGLMADPTLRNRIELLASKSTEGGLTEEERAEYEGYVRANKFVAVLINPANK